MRRAYLCAVLLVAAATLAAVAQRAGAQSYPSRPIRFVIPFPGGSFSEVTGRLIGQKLAESVGQPVVMDVRPGASGNIGAEIVVRSAPDGHTLLLNSFNYVSNPGVMPLSFDPLRDLSAVSLVADGVPLVFVVSAAAPYRTVQELIAQGKAKPGQLNWASSGRGTSSHLVILMLKQLTGLEVNHVPYKGTSQSFNALLGGEVTAATPYLNVAMPLIRSGRLRGLAVTGRQRSPALPDLPTMVEMGYAGLAITGFAGLLAPAGTPAPVIARLHREMVAIGKQKDFADRLAVYDLQPVASTPESFAKYLAAEIAKWKKVFHDAGEKPGV
ncbi:MAG: tripartite tricarboxylate transporter substrate binding protein [Burkholderiales bacterium]|nr:tripartite tricarboxylate transporter substrate binding protein [Burkholderiales bacterium]